MDRDLFNYHHRNVIPTQKKRTRYSFIPRSEYQDRNRVDPNSTLTFYYQICMFKNPDDNKYHMRKYVVNGNNEFINIKDYRLNSKQNKKFYSMKKQHEYKRFGVFHLDNVPPPSLFDVSTSKSDILGKDYDYTGYAPF